MKTAILISLISLLGFGDIRESSDKSRGFVNYRFGSSVSEYTNLKLVSAESNLKSYFVTKPPRINGAELEYLRLTFYNDKLSDIALVTKNATGEKLLGFLEATYGKPKAENQIYEWSGQNIKLIYEALDNSKDAEIFVYDLN